VQRRIPPVTFITLACIVIVAGAYLLFLNEPQMGIRTQGLNQTVEIREFHGAKLSSMTDFRENSIKGPQAVDRDTYRLAITGLVENATELSYQEIIDGFPHEQKVVTLHCVEGWDVTVLYEGVRVSDLIALAKPSKKANTVIFKAGDGYTTSLPLDYIRNRQIILGYRMNGVELPKERGFPFQLVAEDRWGYKWIKWVTGIELSDDPYYRGYWEQRGFALSGELNMSFFG
jgi:DMSO/TMAO reductase YedYZ molybdopterin-dependent catalytic subunit